MAKLSYAERKALPTNVFAIPSERKFPINDRPHARNALSRVSAFGSPAEQRQVQAKVHAKYPDIGKGKKKKGRKR